MTVLASARRRTRGFTLTEIAIVLGIIGIILGAIWAAAAMVYENNRTKSAREETLAIINNWRSIYGSRRVDLADGTAMTQLTVDNSFEPSDMLGSNTCVQGGGSSSCYINGPWVGSQVTVAAKQTNNAVQVVYNDLTQTACNHFANVIADAASLVYMDINGTNRTFPPLGTGTTFKTSEVSAYCTTGNANVVTVQFSMN